MAIITREVMELIMFDLMKLPVEDEEGYQYVFVIKDHYSKYSSSNTCTIISG